MTMLLARLYAAAHGLPAEPKRFVKFLIVGTLGFTVDFGAFNLIHFFYNQPNTRLDENIAQAVSFTLATLSNFTWNYLWIYPEAKSASQARKVSKFFIVSIMGLIIRTPIFNLALPVGERVAQSLPLPVNWNVGGNLALAAAVSVVLLWNFFVNRYWTYRDVN
jgi:putative flippase GtrA